MNATTYKRSFELALMLAVCGLAFLQVASLPVENDDKLATVDLRQTGCVHQIEDEGTCAASYAYASMALSAYYICITKPEADGKRSVDRYHARFVSDCSEQGCEGGLVGKSIGFIRENGLPLFADFESALKAADLKEKCPKIDLQQVEFLKEAQLIRLNHEEVHDHLINVGPVVANLHMWPGYESYKGSVYEAFLNNKAPESRSMMIVGFGYDAEHRPYYALWNSMGTQWGESGYLKIYEHSLWLHQIMFYGLATGDIDESRLNVE